jgi:hypothetical protein
VLRERGQTITIEIPLASIEHDEDDPSRREALRVRMKVRRDRMLFRAPPARLSKSMSTTPAPSFGRPGGYGGGSGRGRR